jgi:hypothetical protein
MLHSELMNNTTNGGLVGPLRAIIDSLAWRETRSIRFTKPSP